MDRLTEDVLRKAEVQLNHRRLEIETYYAELKLKLPTYLKALTLKELRDAGAIVDPYIYIPKQVDRILRADADTSKRKFNVLEKLEDTRKQYRNQITNYFKNFKQKQTKEFLKSKLHQLDNEHWLLLGINMENFRKQLESNSTVATAKSGLRNSNNNSR